MKSFVAIALALSAIVIAAPTEKTFAIGVTVAGKPTYYMKSDASVTQNIAEAAQCSINAKTELNCGAGPIVSGTVGDMAMMNGKDVLFGSRVTEGFSVDDKDMLHWHSDKFMLSSKINNEASFALKKAKNPSGYVIYAQLGCEHSFHTDSMTDGTAKVYYK